MATEDCIVFRQGISSGFAGLEVAKFEHTFVRSATNNISISSQTRQDYEPVLSASVAPVIISDDAASAAIDQVIYTLEKIWNPIKKDPLVWQGAPPLNYYNTAYGICFIRGGELVWANYLPERGVRPPSSEETASAEEESQFKVVVDTLQSLVPSSQAA
ncbi:hypothetical protein K503DRAFT_863830 [Rhizopogon vinicolor AM-OR11-026]|uniref:Uncharacterized protein n=1 Tax=Rhizopogon vinicolor AM-OR11-026 TaxID=1314800 RepID=A0A1B7N9G5_9AGAM|nr:hypothetical protein K503DRAFT_863830 [Rhizopogon vinicolor AM-OR11-026]